MILTEQQATERLSSERNLANRFKVTELRRPGMDFGKKTLSPEVTTTVALLTRAGETQASVGKLFGITQARAHQIETGKGAAKVDEKLVSEKLGKVRDTALEKLTDALLGMTPDKLAATDAKGLSSIAANMSKVVEGTMPKNANTGNTVEVHVYAPEIRPERLYNKVEV